MRKKMKKMTKNTGLLNTFLKSLTAALLFILMTGLTVMPVSAKGENDDTNLILTKEQENLLARADGEKIIASDDVVTCILDEDTAWEDDKCLTTRETPFTFNTKSFFYSFTGTPGINYVILIKIDGQPYITRYYLDTSGGFVEDDLVDYLDEAGSFSAQMFGFLNFSDTDYPERAVETSKVVYFSYRIPSKSLQPGKPKLSAITDGDGKPAVKVEWDKIPHGCFYKVSQYMDDSDFALMTTWQGDGTDNTYIWHPGYSNTGTHTRFSIRAYSDDVNQFSGAVSPKSQYVYVYSNKNFSIHDQPVTVFPTEISVKNPSLNVVVGESKGLSASVLPANAPDRELTYSSSKPAIATVDQNGIVKGVAKGKTDIVIKAINGISTKIPVTVGVNPTSIELDKTSCLMYVGQESTLVPTLAPADVTEKNITWTISKSAVGKTEIGQVDNGTIKMWGAGKVTVTAKTVNGLTAKCEITCLAEDNPDNPFADVKESGWEYGFVKYAFDNGLMNGKGELIPGKVLLAPGANISRAEFVQILYKYEGSPEVEYSDIFSDVPENAWYAKAVMWASKNGIVSGKGVGLFDPDSPAARQQIALMLYKYAIYKDFDVDLPDETKGGIDDFDDASKTEAWAADALNWALSEGIINGKGVKLDPGGKTKRSEFAAMIYRFDNYSATADRLVTVPDIVGMTYADAAAVLDELRLIIACEEQCDPRLFIETQDIKPGEKVKKNTTINVTVTREKQDNPIQLPEEGDPDQLKPDNPETPDNPENPDIPDVPETPDEPENPDIPDVPETPDAPVNPEVPDVPETPDAPVNPDAPDVPEMPDVPENPDIPNISEISDVSAFY